MVAVGKADAARRALVEPGGQSVKRATLAAALGVAALAFAGCASTTCPPDVRVVQQRGAKPQLGDALALAQQVLARDVPSYDSGVPLQVVYDDVYAINATNLAWNWEQAWLLCVSYASIDGSRKREGVAMRLGPDGQPFHVSSINWRDYTGPACR